MMSLIPTPHFTAWGWGWWGNSSSHHSSSQTVMDGIETVTRASYPGPGHCGSSWKKKKTTPFILAGVLLVRCWCTPWLVSTHTTFADSAFFILRPWKLSSAGPHNVLQTTSATAWYIYALLRLTDGWENENLATACCRVEREGYTHAVWLNKYHRMTDLYCGTAVGGMTLQRAISDS